MAEQQPNRPAVQRPESLWIKCTGCDQIIYKKELEENLKVCPKCGQYLRMTARERIALLVDADEGGPRFEEMDAQMTSLDPLQFGDPASDGAAAVPAHPAKAKVQQSYAAKVASEQKKAKVADAVICGEAEIGGRRAVLAVMDFHFMGGSMGSVVGEKVTRAIERATEKRLPVIIMSASGGARMQEGILSLMQMAKTSAALARLHEAGCLAISILCDPTTGGVTASFAMLGDLLLAEPKALIAFAGPRVIEQTIHQKLPEGFQQSEFLLKHGMIDCIVERKQMKAKLASLLGFFQTGKSAA